MISIKPTKKEEKGYGWIEITYFCTICRNEVGVYDSETGMCFQDKFCRECGQKIDWSEEE